MPQSISILECWDCSYTLIRVQKNRVVLKQETVWFAAGDYSRNAYPADITYFRQHTLQIDPSAIVSHETFHTLFIDLADDLDAVLSRTTKTVRYEIARAERDGIALECSTTLSSPSASAFIARHAAFNASKKLGRPLTAYDLQLVEGQWRLYTATFNDNWIAHLLILSDAERFRQWVAISNTEFAPRATVGYASKALVWRSIVDAKQTKCRVYDFGGIITDPDHPSYGITEYKKSFGGTQADEANALVIPNPLYRTAFRLMSRAGLV